MDWAKRGKWFELLEKAQWQGVQAQQVLFEHGLSLIRGKRGRIDIFINEVDGSVSIVEVKASDWDVMAEHRIRPNALRHARQVLKYVYPLWEMGVDVCPGLVYPRSPKSIKRRRQIEGTLAERSIQVVWAAERYGSDSER